MPLGTIDSRDWHHPLPPDTSYEPSCLCFWDVCMSHVVSVSHSVEQDDDAASDKKLEER